MVFVQCAVSSYKLRKSTESYVQERNTKLLSDRKVATSHVRKEKLIDKAIISDMAYEAPHDAPHRFTKRFSAVHVECLKTEANSRNAVSASESSASIEVSSLHSSAKSGTNFRVHAIII